MSPALSWLETTVGLRALGRWPLAADREIRVFLVPWQSNESDVRS